MQLIADVEATVGDSRKGANFGRDQCNSTSRMIESARQTYPDDCLLLRRVSRFVSLAMCVLEQNEAAGRYMPRVSVAGLVFGRSIESHCEHALRRGMPIYLSRARRNAREANACGCIIRRHFECCLRSKRSRKKPGSLSIGGIRAA
jgi:hypothetical protein